MRLKLLLKLVSPKRKKASQKFTRQQRKRLKLLLKVKRVKVSPQRKKASQDFTATYKLLSYKRDRAYYSMKLVSLSYHYLH